MRAAATDRARRDRPCPCARRGFGAGQIDHGRRLDAAGPGVEHEIDVVLEPRADLLGIVQRQLIAGQLQGRDEQRLVELIEQRVRDRMVRDAQADGLARGCARRRGTSRVASQDERVAARRDVAQQAIGGVVDAWRMRRSRTGRGTSASDGGARRCGGSRGCARPRPCRRGGSPARSTSRSGYATDAAVIEDLRGLAQQAHLRVYRVDDE